MVASREWHLVHRPQGRPTEEDVRLVTTEVGDPDAGEVRVENLVMSVEPYMRGRMDDGPSYAKPYALDVPMHGRAVGRVTASDASMIPEGSLVLTNAGWREHAIVAAEDCTMLADLDLPPSVHLGALGITGMTAWVGIERVARLQPGESVFVSSAAGGVGSMVVQMAKARGCPVIGSAGSDAKVAWLRDELGVDAAFCHRDGPPKRLLSHAMEEAGVDGLDVYFDNVGGEQLEAAIRALRLNARIALCGMISIYNEREPVAGPRNLIRLIWQRVRMEGFLVMDHEDGRPDFEAQMRSWLRSGVVQNVETVVGRGIEEAWSGLLAMLSGQGVGKAVVPLA